MKTKKIEKWLLLEQSGELSPRQIRSLSRMLASSEEARALRNELGRLKGSIIFPDEEPSPWTVTKIAARLREERRPVFSFSKVWRPALAVAACSLMVTGILNFHGKQVSSAPVAVVAAAGVDVWDDPFEEDLSRLENLIVAISGDPLDIMEM
jgi:ferric-dicitrate binding protein FerR (iron transport regulator)